uniref:HERV-H LTR-associating protein 1 n=1 Tax=Melopsittacus undulatus TaxID=13146 RepID=A0A8C6NGJ6_MELUD
MWTSLASSPGMQLCFELAKNNTEVIGKLYLSPDSILFSSHCSESSSFSELPAKSVDLAAVNLTELINGMLNTVLRGTKKLFSLLSITSYSSFAFHKESVTIYNISNVKNVDPGKFPMHYCYCLNNVTNDLTDFTALLVDITGNSTSYLTEIFKSTSILSVRQSNDSDCIYICVMTGQTGRNLSDFWEVLEKSPVINYTFSSNTSSDLEEKTLNLEEYFSFFFCYLHIAPQCVVLAASMGYQHTVHSWCPPSTSPASAATRIPLAQEVEEIITTRSPPGPKTVGVKELFPPLHVDDPGLLGTAGPHLTMGGSSTPSPALQPSPSDSELCFSLGCSQAMLKDFRVTSPPVTLLVQKINPCVMELCRFFQLCLCVGQRRYSRKEGMRYCVEYYSWFLKNANYVCARVKRVAYSQTLKQKCLKNICTSV